MGARLVPLRSLAVEISSTVATSVCSAAPANFLIFQTRAFLCGSYTAFPALSWNLARAVCIGTGISTTQRAVLTFEAYSERILTVTSIRVLPCSVISVVALNGRWMPSVTRYFASSNSPSGGTKLRIWLSLYRPRLTHGWNVTPFTLHPAVWLESWAWSAGTDAPPEFTTSPSLTSGMPLRQDRIVILPLTSALKTSPFDDINTDTLSVTSKYTSFFLYFTLPSFRQPTAPVTCIVDAWAWSSFFRFSRSPLLPPSLSRKEDFDFW
mmetsp:Transcript_7376/g.20113  ORF Transcript_7376/g.20113 Transcript_7376/m.20113 type:complete len:266 (+) Transcript_7376:2223-3020(+)